MAPSLVACKAEVQAQPLAPPPPPRVEVAVATPPPPPPPVVEVVKKKRKFSPATLEGNRIKLPGPIVFKTGTADLDPVSDEVLEIVFDYMFEKPAITLLRVEGHTDNVGGKEPNQQLSEKRAMAAARWLVAKGIDCHRIIPVGFGENKPTATNNTDEGRSQNRRVDFVNAELKGKAIGGMPKDGGGHIAGDPCR